MSRHLPGRWSSAAKWFHWTSALLVLTQLPLGWAAATWRLSPLKLDLFVWHKSLGFLILLLTVLRLVSRIAGTSPPPPEDMPRWARRSARGVHVTLYAVLIAMPLSGWIINSAANIPFKIFWAIPVPALTAPDKATAALASSVHLGLFAILSFLLALHIGAALWHHFARRDDVLTRMLPQRGTRT